MTAEDHRPRSSQVAAARAVRWKATDAGSSDPGTVRGEAALGRDAVVGLLTPASEPRDCGAPSGGPPGRTD